MIEFTFFICKVFRYKLYRYRDRYWLSRTLSYSEKNRTAQFYLHTQFLTLYTYPIKDNISDNKRYHTFYLVNANILIPIFVTICTFLKVLYL